MHAGGEGSPAQTQGTDMRSKRRRSAEHLESEGRTTKRRKQPNKSAVPKLGLWECGIGSVWK
jgi:hypothetical protein